MRMPRMAIWIVVAMVAGLLAPQAIPAERAEAASASEFRAGNLISDENFFAGNAMTSSEVQSFLSAQLPVCDTGYTCLPAFQQATPAKTATAYCAAMPGLQQESAASIIARVGSACGVSQRVLLVLLQKEQSLVTDRNPSQLQYARATGFACPDTAPCDSTYAGFFDQVYAAARQFKLYAARPASYNHRAGQWNSVLYHPNAACGSSRVYIANQATAGLYNYTPYQPNGAALNNLYGTGDGCSAYGNRNFWRMYTDWFGDPLGPAVPAGSPIGAIEAASAGPTAAVVAGYAMDPSDPARGIDVNLYVNGRWGGTFRAGQDSASAGAVPGGYGRAHGFSIRFEAGAPSFEICVAALNVGNGADQWLGCRTLEKPTGPPIGQIDSSALDGTNAVLSGWTLDPDVTDAISVHAYVNGRYAGSSLADVTRMDVARAYPDYGSSHGFRVSVPVGVGTNQVCLFAINSPRGDNPSLGCRSFAGASGPPQGQIDSKTSSLGSVSMSGWALDPDVAEPISVTITVDGVNVANVTADAARSDIAAAFPGYGSAHGWSATVPVNGTATVCAIAVNVGGGTDRTLGCFVAETPTGSPIGRIDSAGMNAASGALELRGWTIDPDSADPVAVRLYVDGALIGDFRANGSRPDIAAAFPGYGEAHGLQSIAHRVPPGRHDVCAWALNVGGGESTLLGCARVATEGPPFGRVDSAGVAADGTLQLNGWVIDPDVVDPVAVNVYVDGVLARQFPADATRPDVANVYPLYGQRHGLHGGSITIQPGAHDVCVWAISVGAGDSTLLGCPRVTR